jgi:hypothetical protein
MTTTIEVYTISILKDDENFSFSSEPDLYTHFEE